MITFAQKPGLYSYWVTETRFVELVPGRFCIENLDVTGYGRFRSTNIVFFWDLPFLKVFKDGDHWCVLVGPNLQEGTAEFYPIDDEKNIYDQVTDAALEYCRAHPYPETKHGDRVEYWLPRDIELMAKQSRLMSKPQADSAGERR